MSELGPLRGISVVEMTVGWPGSMCGRLLSDLGARVCKLVSPEIDELSDVRLTGRASWAIVNASKEIIEFRKEDGGALRRLLQSADVVIRDEWGLGFSEEQIGSRGERSIWCDVVSLDGSRPLPHPLPDLILQALSGVMDTTGESSREPLRVGSEPSSAIGALFSTVALLAALYERENSHLGQCVTVSVGDAMTVSTTNFASRVLAGLPPLTRLGNQGPNTAPWNMFPTRDGSFVYIAAGNDMTFRRLCDVMDRTELADDPELETEELRRVAVTRVTQIVTDWTLAHTAEEVDEVLRNSGVPASPVRSLRHLVVDHSTGSFSPVRIVTDMHDREWSTAESPLGTPSYAEPFVSFGVEPRGDRDVPAVPTPLMLSNQQGVAPNNRPPLDGVEVVEIGIQTAGPYCCRILADLGADVLKVEPVAGEQGRRVPPLLDGASVYFDISNANKRGEVADLSSDEGVDTLRSHLEHADAVVTNISVSSLQRRGVDLEALAASDSPKRPVVTLLSGFGFRSNERDRKAYDTVVQAASGMMSVTGYSGGVPTKAGISAADYLGALAGAAATIAGLLGRRRGGNVPLLDVSLLGVAAWSTQPVWSHVIQASTDLSFVGSGSWRPGLHDVFECADGYVVLVAPTEGHDEDFSRLLISKLSSEPMASLSTVCAASTVDSVVEAAKRCGISAHAVNSVATALAGDDLRDRGLVRTVSRPEGGTIQITGMPFRFSRSPLVDRGGAPRLAPERGLSYPRGEG